MHGSHDMHGDHGDMMAIVGEPSADGLVMEPIEVRFGPVGTPLPGGLVVDVTLDGDVVSDAAVHALLSAAGPPNGVPHVPDLLAPVSWRVVIERAAGDVASEADRWLRLAAVETERAVSHLAWLRSFGRLLGWTPLVGRCTAALGALAEPHRQLSGAQATQARPALPVGALEPPRAPVRDVIALVTQSRWLRVRAGGRAVVTAAQARERRLRGPVARASGLAEDSRSHDPLYQRLGFAPLLGSEGDALARTRLRAEEAAAALDLAAGALRAAAAWTPADTMPTAESAIVEAPRGPVEARRTRGGWRLSAPGADEALVAAGDGMRGLEWAAALVVVASFDLSPWRVFE
jgi:NADH:ubiquinone oxidoreductase subunit D